ncbi:SDR family oxidoreductase [Sphingomonas crusticola]|uniref:SDR family oxidoreductase n=1 Tax=Sphingomonas crusticola TaxID=1697973 RepID=UPI000E24216B|nr:SDR family oxidoreductase [Sphingomonas crusticola]
MAGRVALITGAGTGIGRAASLALAARGYRIALAGRHAETLEAVGAQVEIEGGEALAVPTDVTDPDAVRALFDAAVDRFGRVDLLFNNAGTNVPGVPLDQLSYADWRAVIDVNLTGAFLCLQNAFRVMKAQRPGGGRIINNGSISAHSPRPNSSPYTASKHAITGLTKSASLDGRAFDIACGQIDIGNAGTDMALAMTKGVPQANGAIAVEPVFDVTLVGEAIAYMDSLPLDANVQFMTVMATKMPFVGRG